MLLQCVNKERNSSSTLGWRRTYTLLFFAADGSYHYLGLNDVSNLTFGICINGRNTSDERENDVCTNENNNDRGYNKEDDNFFHCWYGSKMKYSVIDLPLS